MHTHLHWIHRIPDVTQNVESREGGFSEVNLKRWEHGEAEIIHTVNQSPNREPGTCICMGPDIVVSIQSAMYTIISSHSLRRSGKGRTSLLGG